MRPMTDKRTPTQNNAIHKYCDLAAETLNFSGFEMKAVLEKKAMDVPWSKETFKRCLWIPAQRALFNKEHSSELTTAEVDKVYQVLARFLSTEFGVDVAFPSKEE